MTENSYNKYRNSFNVEMFLASNKSKYTFTIMITTYIFWCYFRSGDLPIDLIKQL